MSTLRALARRQVRRRFATTCRLASARFWLIITKAERKIASSETIIVNSRFGYFSAPSPIQSPNQAMDVDEPHRTGERGDLVGDSVLDTPRSLFGVIAQRRVRLLEVRQPLKQNRLLSNRPLPRDGRRSMPARTDDQAGAGAACCTARTRNASTMSRTPRIRAKAATQAIRRTALRP